MRKIKNNIVNVIRDPDTNIAHRKQKEKDPNNLQLQKDSIYIRHREFLNGYKSAQNQTIFNKQSEILNNSSTKSQLKVELTPLNESNDSKIAQSQIEEAMQKIHQRLIKDLLGQSRKQTNEKFKIFTTIISNKKDIDRVNKEKRFIKST